jgi:Dictyostelium (slime mold) repeat
MDLLRQSTFRMARVVAAIGWIARSATGGVAHAAIPEPDVVFHGVPRLEGQVLQAGDEVSIRIGTDVLEAYTVGEAQGAGPGRYILRVPLVQLSAGEVRPADRAVTGSRATILCRRGAGGYVAAGEVTIGERGTVTLRDLDCAGGVVTTTTVPGSSTTTIAGGTTTTTPGGSTSTTTTTLPQVCGNGVADTGEDCGDPGTRGCEADDRCAACRCETCPTVLLTCAGWVQSQGGAPRRASVIVVPGPQPVRGIDLRWNAAQLHVDRIGEPNGGGDPPAVACTIDQPQAAASCSQTAPGAVSVEVVEIEATPASGAPSGARLAVTRLVDGAGASFPGCALPGGCCAVASDCDPGDRCHLAPTCGSDFRCKPGDGIVCDDGDACTRDTCAAATGCQSTPIPPAERGPAGTCAVTNVKALLPRVEGLSDKAKTRLVGRVDGIERALQAALAAPKPKTCTRKLSAAAKLAKALRKTVQKLIKKNLLGDAGPEVVTVVERLGERIQRTQQEAKTFCARTS